MGEQSVSGPTSDRLLRACALALALASCSLSRSDVTACSSSSRCREVFGFGSVCNADGYCEAMRKNPRCNASFPKDLLSRPESYPSAILIGSLMDRSLATHVAREAAIILAATQADEAGGLGGRYFGVVLCDIAKNTNYDSLDHTEAALQRRLTSSTGYTLYALLDAARSPRILELLHESVDEHQSLFEGLPGAALSRVAPYLVRLEPETSPLFARLLADGWGQSWGVFVLSAAPFKQVRRHFRRHLRVEDPDSRSLYFRLYDPRVLRRFLPMASARQLHELFAEVACFALEDAPPTRATLFTITPEPTLRSEHL